MFESLKATKHSTVFRQTAGESSLRLSLIERTHYCPHVSQVCKALQKVTVVLTRFSRLSCMSPKYTIRYTGNSLDFKHTNIASKLSL